MNKTQKPATPAEHIAEEQTTELAKVQTAVVSMNALTAGLADLSERFKGVIYEVTTPKGMADAKAARKEIATPRIEVEKIRKAAKAPILELGRKLDAEAARITKELEALELPIDQQILAEENRIKAEREAAVKAEQDRVAGIMARVEGMRALVQRGVVARASSELTALMDQMDAILIDASFAEMEATAADTKTEVYIQLAKMREAALAREQEAERLAAQRAELDRRQAEQDERDRLARAAEETERVRKAGIEQRINYLRGNQTFTAMSAPMLIDMNLQEIKQAPITEGVYQERLAEAIEVRDATIERLGSLYVRAHDYRREQERQQQQRDAQAAEQKRLDDERAELVAAQQREREAQEAKERDARLAEETRQLEAMEEQNRREREIAAEKARNFKPEAEAIVHVLCTTYARDAETVTGWLREYFGAKQKKAA